MYLSKSALVIFVFSRSSGPSFYTKAFVSCIGMLFCHNSVFLVQQGNWLNFHFLIFMRPLAEHLIKPRGNGYCPYQQKRVSLRPVLPFVMQKYLFLSCFVLLYQASAFGQSYYTSLKFFGLSLHPYLSPQLASPARLCPRQFL